MGDNYYADVIGARRAGLMPVLYDPQGIFPDPDCASIASFDELPTMLKPRSKGFQRPVTQRHEAGSRDCRLEIADCGNSSVVGVQC